MPSELGSLLNDMMIGDNVPLATILGMSDKNAKYIAQGDC